MIPFVIIILIRRFVYVSRLSNHFIRIFIVLLYCVLFWIIQITRVRQIRSCTYVVTCNMNPTSCFWDRIVFYKVGIHITYRSFTTIHWLWYDLSTCRNGILGFEYYCITFFDIRRTFVGAMTSYCLKSIPDDSYKCGLVTITVPSFFSLTNSSVAVVNMHVNLFDFLELPKYN